MVGMEQESLELRMGGGGRGSRSGQPAYETIKFSFMPESVSGKPGKLWKSSGGKGELKVFAEFAGGEGQDPVRYNGSVQKKENINDCVLVIKGGRATLHKLNGINILTKVSGSVTDFPTTRPQTLPDNLKRKYGVVDDGNEEQDGGHMPAPAVRGAAIASSDDESSDDSDSSDGEEIKSRATGGGGAAARGSTSSGIGGKGKGLLSLNAAAGAGTGASGGGAGGGGSGGGKGLMVPKAVGGGKGLMGAAPAAENPSSDDDESDDDESYEDSD